MLMNYNALMCRGSCDSKCCSLHFVGHGNHRSDQDVNCIHPDMHFFSSDSQFAKFNQDVPLFVFKFTQTPNSSLF